MNPLPVVVGALENPALFTPLAIGLPTADPKPHRAVLVGRSHQNIVTQPAVGNRFVENRAITAMIVYHPPGQSKIFRG